MIKRERKLVVSFYTTTAAMAMEQACREAGLPGRMIPVPTEIAADCGLAWCADPVFEEDIRALMQKKCIEAQGMQQCLV